ncbi:MAG: ABC transporter ATP-binding protein [Saprospiraceae bacterium]|nr:ABC transporter ATP-binding protein [Saprospiraceae bacterium]
MKKRKPLLSVRDLNKTFSNSDIKYSMLHGIQDLFYDLLGIKNTHTKLRDKEFWTLKNINFDLFEGDILGIVGSNGSGKTTLMRTVANIYQASSGAIYGKKNLKVIAIFTLSTGFRELFTGRENIYIKGAMFGMSKSEIDAKLAFIESFSELGKHLDKPLGNYSSGMKARLAYSIAIATEPDVFIIDEALAVGDSVFKAKCFDHLKQYVKKPNKAVLFVSNQIRKILRISNRLMVMQEGQIIHESSDIREGLHFYIKNCLSHLSEEERKHKLNRILDAGI